MSAPPHVAAVAGTRPDAQGGWSGDLAAPLPEVDPELARIVANELVRQRATIDMVASENFAPEAVLQLQGSVLTNKYADGYPGGREYDGCEWVDEAERLAIERAKALFGAEHANVQPYSGSSANYAVLQALCEPGDPVLGWDFTHGGHPSHYDRETVGGRFYRGSAYHVRREDRLVDMDEVAELARRHRPRVIFAGWSCYPRHIDYGAFREIADEVGAYLVADMAHVAGIVAAGLHPDPVPFADVCTFTVHKTLGGARGGAILCRAELAERIDAGVFPGSQGGPLAHVTAAYALTFALARTPAFRERMERTLAGASLVASRLQEAAGETQVAVVTGGTEVHQFLLDVSGTGRDATEVMGWLHALSVNANPMAIAYDPRPAPGMSGLRLGTTSLATRGFREADFAELAEVLVAGLGPERERRRPELAGRTRALAEAHPVYPGLG